ncbi:hypothetical protein COCNU_scaffold003777G000010 [Cocos nucifera]|nr:hypothetical protein [Cocos nucifera]
MGSGLASEGDRERKKGRSRAKKAGRKGFSLTTITDERDRERKRGSDRGDGTQSSRVGYAVELARAMIEPTGGGLKQDVSGMEPTISSMEPGHDDIETPSSFHPYPSVGYAQFSIQGAYSIHLGIDCSGTSTVGIYSTDGIYSTSGASSSWTFYGPTWMAHIWNCQHQGPGMEGDMEEV